MTSTKKLINAIGKSIAGRYFVYLTQMLSLVVLSRIYAPEAFGFFAVIQVFAVFFVLLSEMGFGPAIINIDSISERERNGIFSSTIVIGVLIGSVFLLSSPIIATTYSDLRYIGWSIPVSLSVIFLSGSTLPLASLQKDGKFIAIAKVESVAELSALFLTILLMDFFDPVLGLALKSFYGSFIRFFLLWRSSQETTLGKAELGKNFGAIKLLMDFSKHQIGFNILNYFSRNLDNLLVGRYLGAFSLGIYDKSYQLMRYPLMLLTFAMAPAIQPTMKSVHGDRAEFERLHNRMVQLLSLIGMVVALLVYSCSELIVKIVLGDQWSAVVPILAILSFSIPTQMVCGSSGGVFQAANKPNILFACGALTAFINVSAIIYGTLSGSLEILAFCLLCSFALGVFVVYGFMAKYVFFSCRFLINIIPLVIFNMIGIFYCWSYLLKI